MLSHWSSGRRVFVSTLFCLWVIVLIVTAFQGFAPNYAERLVQEIALVLGAVVLLTVIIGALILRMANYREPATEDEFERLVLESEYLAQENLAPEPDEGEFLTLDPHNPRDFEQLVREALDDLPDLLIKALSHVAVVVSDQGHKRRAYGMYQGDTIARDNYPDRIIIFRDTLLRDFGHDPDLLRDQVTRVVRHELAHHLGANELGVEEMGL